MKILVLNPHLDAVQETLEELRGAGHALLLPESADEAWQLIQMHASSLDLAWLHREGSGAGIDLLTRIRAQAETQALAVLLTTEEWNESQCAEHQETTAGANAYLRWPAHASAIVSLVGEIFGETPAAPALELAEPSAMPSAPSGIPTLELPTGFGTPSSAAAPTSVALELPLDPPPALPEIAAPSDGASLAAMLTPPPSLPLAGQDGAEGSAESSAPADAELARDMPYLYGHSAHTAQATPNASVGAPLNWGVPLGDAVVPGGAAQSPDMETLKKYLLLREQDVSALSAQLKTTRDQVQSMEGALQAERARSSEFQHALEQARKQIDEFEKIKADALAAQAGELQELQFQLKARNDALKSLEARVRESTSEVEQIKERVRQDIRKIRVREKELENRLEITRRDSDALLTAREGKIIELKRRLDLLEFNMDLLQDQYNKQREANQKLEEKLNRAAQVVRVAGGLLVEQKQAS